VTVLQAGILKDKKIMQRIFPGIEKGPLLKVNALVIHQTGALSAQNTFNSYLESTVF
jgi:hypothetical protein